MAEGAAREHDVRGDRRRRDAVLRYHSERFINHYRSCSLRLVSGIMNAEIS